MYYLSPLWPYTVNTAVALDSGNVTLVDLVDHTRTSADQGPETVQSHVVWSATGLENVPHVLTMSVGTGQPFGVVDAIMYVLEINMLHVFLETNFILVGLAIPIRTQHRLRLYSPRQRDAL